MGLVNVERKASVAKFDVSVTRLCYSAAVCPSVNTSDYQFLWNAGALGVLIVFTF